MTRRRPLALLSVLAAAGPAGIPRDRILALLWPDADEERGRNVLNQTLFALRRDLGESEVVVGREDLRLNPSVIESDITQFEAALSTFDFQAAADLYAGPFLDGFFLSGAIEFERWVDEVRARTARRAAAALSAVADAAERNGDLSRAVEARWRVAEADPLDSRATLALVRSLALGGDRARAVQTARRHEALLRQELGAGVDREMSRFIEGLLADGHALPELPASSPEVAAERLAIAGRPAASVRPRRHTAARFGAALLLPALVATIWATGARDSGSSSTSDASGSTVVALLPFSVEGVNDSTFLRAALPDLLGRTIDGVGSLHVLDGALVNRLLAPDSSTRPHLSATRGAGPHVDRYLVGRVVSTSAAIRISIAISKRADGAERLAAVSVDGPPSDLLSLVDRLATRVLVALQPGGRFKPTDVGMLSTRSLRALQAFVDGESLRRAAKYAAAIEAYQVAVREDSTFALAWYGLSNAADWASRGDLVLHAARQAEIFAGHLSEHDQLLIRAYRAWRENRPEDAERWYRVLLHGYPNDAEAWYQLADLLFHDNSRRGRSFAEAREPFLRALSLQPSDNEVLAHLIRIAARVGDVAAVDSLTQRALRNAPANEAVYLRAFRAFATGDTAAQRVALRDLGDADGSTLATLAWRVSIFATDLEGAERILRLGTSGKRPPPLQQDARAGLVWVLMGRGQYGAAWEETLKLENAGQSAPGPTVSARVYALVAPDAPSRPALAVATRRHLDSVLASSPRTPEDSGAIHEARCASAVLSAFAGHAEEVARFASLLRGARVDSVDRHRLAHCAAVAQARLEFNAGRSARAVAILLAERGAHVPEGDMEALGRFLLAEALQSLGRDREAEGWYRSISERGVDELSLFAPAERRLAELARRAGDLRSAAAHYRRVVRLWDACDPELRPLVEDARAQLRRVESALVSTRRSPGGMPGSVTVPSVVESLASSAPSVLSLAPSARNAARHTR